jgi:hypothetical protein
MTENLSNTKDAGTAEAVVARRASHCYLCDECGAKDCKLWRPSHVFANQVELTCWKCLEAKGHSIHINEPHGSDQIYNPNIEHTNYVPAVPDLDGSWWGYTSVPGWWVAWWKALPDTKDDCTCCRGTGKLAEFDCMFCEGTGAR